MVEPGTFTITATSDRFWNKDQFVAFLLQNRHSDIKIKLRLEPEAIDLAQLGVYDLLDIFGIKSVEICTGNQLEKHPQHRITTVPNQWLTWWPLIDSTMHTWNQSKTFLAFYHRPSAAKLVLASYLAERYREITALHFSMDTQDDNLVHFELDKSLAYDKRSIARIGNLINQLPLLLDSSDRYTGTHGYDWQDPLTAIYQDILIDVVAESHVMGDTFFPTEKTLRPILLKKPFIVFSNYNFLAYLQQMGFRTFHDYWDESYDGFETTDRVAATYKLIDDLAKRPKSELSSMYRDMQDILDHNYNLLRHRKFSKVITKID